MNINKQTELKQRIIEWTDYLNNGQFKPTWRIDEINCAINVFSKLLENTNDN